MAAGRPVGTIFAEIGLDYEPYTRAQKTLLKDATSTTTNIEKNFKNLGIKSATEFDLMRAKISNSYEMISKSGKASAEDILRAEKAKNEQLKRLNDQQFGHQTSLIESIKKNWLAYSAGVVAAYYAINKAADFIGTLTTAASDLQETQSKSNAVFGASAQAITAWSKDSATAFGMSRQAALESASSIGNMFKQLGAGETQAAKTSKSMVELSADLASFHNVTGGATEVLNAMQSAFRGQYEPIQRYIPTINAAAVEQMALATTGKAATSELTRLEKAAAAQAIIMRDAGDAVGDFAKTSGGLANQQRILDANMTNLKATIGESLMPAVTGIVSKMNDLSGTMTDPAFLTGVTNIAQGFGNLAVGIATATAEAIKFLGKWTEMARARDIGPLSTGFLKNLPQSSGKIGPQTPGYNLYSTSLKAKLGGSGTPPGAAPSSGAAMPTKYLDKLLSDERRYETESAALRLKAIFEMDTKEIAFAKTQGAALGTIVDDERKYEIESSKLRLKAIFEMDKKEADFEKKNADESKKLASEKLQAESGYYNDMKDRAGDYYKYQLNALENERIEYIILTGNKTQADVRYEAKKKDIDRAQMLRSNDFFGGIKVGYEQSLESAVTFAQVGKSTFESFLSSTQSQLSDNFFNVFTGRMDELKWDWADMWDSMARTAADKLADIAVQKGLNAAISGLGWLSDELFGFALGTMDVKKDQLAMVHKGEMILPADIAGNIRNAPESRFATEALFTPRMEAAFMQSLFGTGKGFAASRLMQPFTTGGFSLALSPMTIAAAGAKALWAALSTEHGWGFGGAEGSYGASLGTDPGDPEHGGAGLGGGIAKSGGWLHGPESGYKATLHGSELVLNKDQVKAVREVNAGGGKTENHYHFSGIFTTDDAAAWVSEMQQKIKDNRVGTQYKTIDRSTAGLNI